MSEPLYVGLDAGGTTTRAVVVNLLGRQVGGGVADGGNPTPRGPARAARAVEAALRRALTGVDPDRVRAITIGMAGVDVLNHDPAGLAAFTAAWRRVGVSCVPRLRSDAEVAFAAGTSRPDGIVLIAGTGAAAAVVCDRRVVRCADGYGWLLGDAGSGFWLGRRAAKATLAALEGGRADTPLPALVLTEVLGDGDRPTDARAVANLLVARISRRPPVDLARLAPVVVRAADLGDPDAIWLCQRAADHLFATVGLAMSGPPPAPDIVLAGGLLINPTPVAYALRDLLNAGYPRSTVTVGYDGAAGAAWLAALDDGALDTHGLNDLHDQLLSHRGGHAHAS